MASLGVWGPISLFVGFGALGLAASIAGYLVIAANEKKRLLLPLISLTSLIVTGVGLLTFVYLAGQEDGPRIALRNAGNILNGDWTPEGMDCSHPLQLHVFPESRELVVTAANRPAERFGVSVVDEPQARVDATVVSSGEPVLFIRQGDTLSILREPVGTPSAKRFLRCEAGQSGALR